MAVGMGDRVVFLKSVNSSFRGPGPACEFFLSEPPRARAHTRYPGDRQGASSSPRRLAGMSLFEELFEVKDTSRQFDLYLFISRLNAEQYKSGNFRLPCAHLSP